MPHQSDKITAHKATDTTKCLMKWQNSDTNKQNNGKQRQAAAQTKAK